MKDPITSEHEEILHWIWESCYFNLQSLSTVKGKNIDILRPGEINRNDGPDILDAELLIEGIRWCGDIEIHWYENEWIRHKHQLDKKYNRVILHVVYHEPQTVKAVRQDGTKLHTVCLKAHLPKSVRHLAERFNSSSMLPCSGVISDISDEVIKSQIEKAHKEYFERRVNEITRHYDPDLSPSLAWKKALSLAIFDGLGISANRQPMLNLGILLYPFLQSDVSSLDLAETALELSGCVQRKNSPSRKITGWNSKGVLPNNRPVKRIPQAAQFMWNIHQLPAEEWITNHPSVSWRILCDSLSGSSKPGKKTINLLYHIVFLPSTWVLGTLFHSGRLKKESYIEWLNGRVELPGSITKLYRRSGFPGEIYNHKLGAVHQLKRYCRKRRCRSCTLFMSAINS